MLFARFQIARRFWPCNDNPSCFPMLVQALQLSCLLSQDIVCARAQVVDFQSERASVVEIHDQWRFHTGDDPVGLTPTSTTPMALIRSDQPWDTQGYPGYRGFAWYRFQVVLPAHHAPLALFIPVIYGNYQVFVGGRLVGQLGAMPPEDRLAFSLLSEVKSSYPCPKSALRGRPALHRHPYLDRSAGA